MILFTKIQMEGIGSYIERTKFKLNRPGLNLIIAKNGSGKTTIFSAIAWTLYGIPLKPKSTIPTWESKRPDNFQGTYCSLKFEKEGFKFEVIRCQDYLGKINGEKGKNRILLLIDGVYQEKLRDKKDVQKEIINILGYSFDLFKNSIVFGQKLKRLIEEDGPKKKQIFEEAFESTFINEARSNAEKQYIKLTEEQKPYINDKYTSEKVLETLSENLKQNELQQENFLENKSKKLKEILTKLAISKSELIKSKRGFKEIDTIREELKKLKPKIGQLNDCNKILKTNEQADFKISNGIDTEEMIISQTQQKLKALLKANNKCFACGQKLPKDKIKENILKFKAEKQKAKLTIKSAKENIKDFKSQKDLIEVNIASIIKDIKAIDTYVIQQKKLEKALNEAKTCQSLYSHNEKRFKELGLEFEEEKNAVWQDNTHQIKDKIEAYNKANIILSKRIADYDKELSLYKWAITDPLSNKGLKAYIFDSMLKLVNQKLKKYEPYIGWGVKLSINLDSVNKDLLVIVSKDGVQVKYEDLSGGQSQLINVVTAFALHDATTINKPCNLLVLDEVFEGLDTENVEIISQIIQGKSQGMSIFLITHNQSFTSYSSKIIHLRINDKGQTELKSAS